MGSIAPAGGFSFLQGANGPVDDPVVAEREDLPLLRFGDVFGSRFGKLRSQSRRDQEPFVGRDPRFTEVGDRGGRLAGECGGCVPLGAMAGRELLDGLLPPRVASWGVSGKVE